MQQSLQEVRADQREEAEKSRLVAKVTLGLVEKVKELEAIIDSLRKSMKRKCPRTLEATSETLRKRLHLQKENESRIDNVRV